MKMVFPNWFEVTAKDNFQNHLLKYRGEPDVKVLQLGSFAGAASVWLLENILTGEGSHLDDVDLLMEFPELSHFKFDWKEVRDTYTNAIRPYSNVTFHNETTVEFLKKAPFEYYDFIYVDASHDAVDVLIDAELSWFSLKVGGIIAFDDYTWGVEDRMNLRTPKRGVETFHQRRSHKLTLINKPTTQIWLKKESN